MIRVNLAKPTDTPPAAHPTGTGSNSRFHRVHIGHSGGKTLAHISKATGRVYGLDGRLGWPAHTAPEQFITSCGHEPVRKALEFVRKATGDVDWKSDPSYRWITIHPHDAPDAKGVPVLVKVHADGHAHVVGGAGGSLTGLSLTKLGTESDWKLRAKERAQARQDKVEALKAKQEQGDEKAGKVAEHFEALNEARSQIGLARAEAVAEVAQALGWKDTVRLPEHIAEQMDGKQADRMERARARHMLHEVKRAVSAIQDEVINQHNEDVAKALGDVPIGKILTPEVADAGGRGYMDTIASLAADNGLTQAETQDTQLTTREDRAYAAEAAGYIDSAQASLDAIETLQGAASRARNQDAPFKQEGAHKPETADPVKAIREDPEAAAKVLLAYAKLRQVEKAASVFEQKSKADVGLELGQVHRGVAVFKQAQEMSDADAAKAAEDMLVDRARTQAVANLMEEVDDFEGTHGSVERHLLTARHAQLAALFQQATGAPLPIDRRVCDLLGIDAASTLAAELILDQLGMDEGNAREKLITQHALTQQARASAAVDAARGKIEAANKLVEGLPSLEDADGDTLLTIQTRNQERIRLLQQAGQELGTAMGQLEASGHLNNAMMGKWTGDLKANLGAASTRDALQMLRAMGLSDDEAQIGSDGVNRFVTIKRDAAMAKLTAKPDTAMAEAYEATQAIKRGDEDEDGWLPQGFSGRASSDYAADVASAKAFDVEPRLKGAGTGEALQAAVRDYAGRSLAQDGAGSLTDVRNRLVAPDWQSEHLDPEQRDEVTSYVMEDLLHPKTLANAKKSSKVAQSLIEEATAGDPDRAPLDSQVFNIDKSAFEAMHQAFAQTPAGRLAFEPIADLGHAGSAALRTYFWGHMNDWGSEETPEAKQAKLASLQEKMDKVVDTSTDLFGDEVVTRYGDTEQGKNEWQEAEATLAAGGTKSSGVDAWGHFVVHMGGTSNAYKAVQDHLRGTVLEKFADTHAKLTGQRLMAGQAPMHRAARYRLATMDPEQYGKFTGGLDAKTREDLDALRHRAVKSTADGGQYRSGSVKGLVAKLAEQAVSEQSKLAAEGGDNDLPSRYTLGQTADALAARVASHVSNGFDPSKPVALVHDLSMSGKFAPQQRAVKLVEKMGRQGMHLATGAGKTAVGLGAFAQLHEEGKVKRGVFVVPPKQTGQWQQEALKFLEPGKFQTFSAKGASATERRAAYADPAHHIVMVGHQALRDDVTWAVAKHSFGGDIAAAQKALSQTPGHSDVRRTWERAGRRLDLLLRYHPEIGKLAPEKVAARLQEIKDETEDTYGSTAKNLSNAARNVLSALGRDDIPKGAMAGGKAFREWGLGKLGDAGLDEDTAEKKMHAMVQDAIKKEGWDFDFSMMDEAHDALNRAGKPNSRLANVLDAVTMPHKFHINATATPVKNDTSEGWDLAHKLRPDIYPLSVRASWMRKFGGADNIAGVSEAMRRELAPYVYAQQVDTGVKRTTVDTQVAMTPKQRQLYRETHRAYLDARRAKPGTDAHRSAVLKLFPKARLEGKSEEEKSAMVEKASGFLSSARDAMLKRIVFGHHEDLAPEDIGGFKAVEAEIAKHATDDHDGGQGPGVVFAHNPGVVRKMHEYLTGKGLRVGVIDGSSTLQQADDARDGFFPQGVWDPADPQGSAAKLREKAKYDVLLCSDAASHGLNLQRGKWLVHYDQPVTEKTWQQRTGRIDRIGSMHDEANITNLVHDAPVAQRMRVIRDNKAPLTEMYQQPYELLDQDDTGTAEGITGDRDQRLTDAVELGARPYATPPAASAKEQQVSAT